MYQATTRATIAITERVDCLKLGVGNRCLRNRRDVIEVHKPGEVIQQRLYVLGRRRDERRISWAKPWTSDPVLLYTDHACIVLFGSALQERLVDIYDVLQTEGARLSTYGDRSFHCSNVAQHGMCCRIRGKRLVGGEC